MIRFHFVSVGLVLTFAGPVSGQPPVGRPRPTIKVHKESNRMVKQLELPTKRREAVTRLLALGPLAVPDLQRTIMDPRPEIAVAAMGILRMLGIHAKPALSTLMRLTKGSDKKVAFAARWAMARIHPVGVTLVADTRKQRLVEFDSKGKVLLEIPKQQFIWDAERLPNGNYLVSHGGSNMIHELDRTGKVLWKYDKAQFPMDADRLPSGNTLICDTNKKRVIEVDPSGKVLWEYAKLSRPYDADRLPSGNTLIADYAAGRVLEVDPKGRVVWELKSATHVLSVERLPSGNTLMALWSQSVVREVNLKGKTVFEIKMPAKNRSPSSVQRLANGNTLVGLSGAAIEFDAKGKEVWRVPIGGGGSVIRY